MLVQGTGTGWDVISWAKLRPRQIIATDMFPFEDSWEEITRYCYDHYQVRVDFRVSAIEDVPFLESNRVDLIASDAVYEHCRDLPGVMQESFRILKPGGCIYASYGPLYFCAGGDHFSGRGGLENSFNHLLLDPEVVSAVSCSLPGRDRGFSGRGQIYKAQFVLLPDYSPIS